MTLCFGSCHKEDLSKQSSPNKTANHPISQQDIDRWTKENPVAKFLALDWKNAIKIIIDGKEVLKVALLNESRMPAKDREVTSNNLKVLNNFNSSFEKHPPQVYFVKNNKDSLHTYLLNFIPDNPSKEFGQNNLWTGKLYEWNMNSDSLFVHEYKQNIVVDRYILKSSPKSNINSNNQIITSWFGDIIDSIIDVLNDIGYLLHIPGTTTDSSNRHPYGNTRGWPSFGDMFGGSGSGGYGYDGNYGGGSYGGSNGGGNGYSGGGDLYNDFFFEAGGSSQPSHGPSYDPNNPVGSYEAQELIRLLNLSPRFDSELVFYLKNNDYISLQLRNYLITYGESQENKDFIKWAARYLKDNPNVDFASLNENIIEDDVDIDFNPLLLQQQTFILIPTKIILNNGHEIKLAFGISEDGKSALQKVNKKLIDALKTALENLPLNITINSLFISTSTNGVHDINSNHSRGIALDISRINEVKMLTSGITPEIVSLQQSLENLPNIRENSGPSFKHKNGLPWTISGHQDHIHFSINL